VADIANSAINEIIRGIPSLDFVDKTKDSPGGYWDYWLYVRFGYANRQKYKARMKRWFSDNKGNLEWLEDTRTYRTSPNWSFGNRHPSGGHYTIKN